VSVNIDGFKAAAADAAAGARHLASQKQHLTKINNLDR